MADNHCLTANSAYKTAVKNEFQAANKMSLRIATLVPFLFLILTSTTFAQEQAKSLPTIVNSKISRVVDLASQLVKVTTSIHAENTGSSPVNEYSIAMEPSQLSSISYFDVTLNNNQLPFERKDNLFVVDLTGHSIPAGAIMKQPLIVNVVLTRSLLPLPKEIFQHERQLVQYRGLQVTFSPYLTRTQSTRFKMPKNAKLESFTKATKLTTGVDKLVYGPFKDIQPYSGESLVIHYENNAPFVSVQQLEREIEVSSWSNKAFVANNVRLVHTGAKLKGPFSRLDYQQDHSNGISSVRSFVATIPKIAENIYFRDGIGNISTSSVLRSKSEIRVVVKPRFPLFGGWITDYTLGYSLKLDDLTNLKFTFADVLYDNMHIEQATMRIKLPRGSKDIKVASSYSHSVHENYITLTGKNLISQHSDKPVSISYSYQKTNMLFEPSVLAALGCGAITLIYLSLRRVKS